VLERHPELHPHYICSSALAEGSASTGSAGNHHVSSLFEQWDAVCILQGGEQADDWPVTDHNRATKQLLQRRGACVQRGETSHRHSANKDSGS
jgi:hypothetical protein